MSRTEYSPEQLWRELRHQGIDDAQVLAAMKRVPREHFVAENQRALAYRNAPLPIGEGQTISQPFVIALMLQELKLTGSEKALEIGTGSGYQAAVLAEMADSVISLERHATLAERARLRLELLGCTNVTIHVADGSLGWPPEAPYDAVVVSAGSPSVPDQLLEQLADGGRLILPIGSMSAQELVLVKRQGDSFQRFERGAVRFVPLVGREGWGGQRN